MLIGAALIFSFGQKLCSDNERTRLWHEYHGEIDLILFIAGYTKMISSAEELLYILSGLAVENWRYKP